MVVMVSPKTGENHLKPLITKTFIALETSVEPAGQPADKLWTTLAHRAVAKLSTTCARTIHGLPRADGDKYVSAAVALRCDRLRVTR